MSQGLPDEAEPFVNRIELAKSIQASFAARGHPITWMETQEFLNETIDIVKNGLKPDIDQKISLFRDVVEAHKSEYESLSETGRSLDTKAQGNAAISGVVIGFMLTSARIMRHHYPFEIMMLSISLVVLIFSMFASMCVLLARTERFPPLGEELDAIVSKLDRSPEGITPERSANFLRDYSGCWPPVNATKWSIINEKSKSMILAQTSLMLGIVCTVSLTLEEVWFHE